jgi:hypothetical protein
VPWASVAGWSREDLTVTGAERPQEEGHRVAVMTMMVALPCYSQYSQIFVPENDCAVP